MKTKKELSSADVRVMVAELQRFKGARIDKAYGLDHGTVMIKVRGEEKGTMFFDPKGFLFLSNKSRDAPDEPTSFAMLLRKRISGGRIENIEQHRFDRIVLLDISTGEGTHTLIMELFGGGNMILVKDGETIMPLFHRSWGHRSIRPRQEYVLPQDRPDPTSFDQETLGGIISASDRDIVRALTVDANFGGELAEEICNRSGIQKNTLAGDLIQEEKNRIWESWCQMITSFSSPEPYTVSQEEKLVGFSFLPLVRYSDLEKTQFQSLSDAVENYYDGGTWAQTEKITSAQNRIEQLGRQLEQQEKAISEFLEEAEQSKKKAELLFINYGQIEALLTNVSKAREMKFSWDEIAKELVERGMIKSLDPSERKIEMELEDETGKICIALDLSTSLEENASKLYEEGKKAKEKAKGAETALEETRHQLECIEDEEEQEEEEERKTHWFERYRWFITSPGNLAIAGRDATSNDRVVKRHMKADDRYAHADIHGAPSVVIKALDGQVDEQSLLEACHFSVINSKAWSAKIGSGDAYWVKPDQVSKTPNPGEFLAKGAFVIRGKRNFHRGLPLRAWVCEVEYQGQKLVVTCPPDRSGIARYVEIAPGEEEKSKAARRMAQMFNIPIDEAMRILPPGKIAIMKTSGFTEEE
ncbi:MAG: ribosome rescue protein RqcH [Candidatus Thermoplasmatota archaeon]|nr:ribosome rescue protein RqcH [Candidatus Thermoplasmatota archaeon]